MIIPFVQRHSPAVGAVHGSPEEGTEQQASSSGFPVVVCEEGPGPWSETYGHSHTPPQEAAFQEIASDLDVEDLAFLHGVSPGTFDASAVPAARVRPRSSGFAFYCTPGSCVLYGSLVQCTVGLRMEGLLVALCFPVVPLIPKKGGYLLQLGIQLV